MQQAWATSGCFWVERPLSGPSGPVIRPVARVPGRWAARPRVLRSRPTPARAFVTPATRLLLSTRRAFATRRSGTS
eukprot:1177162-Prorocentrum_minimum.AAC.3